MATAKHDNMSGSATGRRGAADEKTWRRKAGTYRSQFFRRQHDRSQSITGGEYETSWSAVGLSPCLLIHYYGSNLNLLANDHCPTPDAD